MSLTLTYLGVIPPSNTDSGCAIAFNVKKGLIYFTDYNGNTQLFATGSISSLTKVQSLVSTNRVSGANGGVSLAFDMTTDKLVIGDCYSNANFIGWTSVDSSTGYMPNPTTFNQLANVPTVFGVGCPLALGCNGAGIFALNQIGTNKVVLVRSSDFFAQNGVIYKTITLPRTTSNTNSNGSIGISADCIYYRSGSITYEYNFNTGVESALSFPSSAGEGCTISQDGKYFATDDYSFDKPYMYSCNGSNSILLVPTPPASVTTPVKARLGTQISPSWSSSALPSQPSGSTLDDSNVYYKSELYKKVDWDV